jgi:hypothetical protein
MATSTSIRVDQPERPGSNHAAVADNNSAEWSDRSVGDCAATLREGGVHADALKAVTVALIVGFSSTGCGEQRHTAHHPSSPPRPSAEATHPVSPADYTVGGDDGQAWNNTNYVFDWEKYVLSVDYLQGAGSGTTAIAPGLIIEVDTTDDPNFYKTADDICGAGLLFTTTQYQRLFDVLVSVMTPDLDILSDNRNGGCQHPRP